MRSAREVLSGGSIIIMTKKKEKFLILAHAGSIQLSGIRGLTHSHVPYMYTVHVDQEISRLLINFHVGNFFIGTTPYYVKVNSV